MSSESLPTQRDHVAMSHHQSPPAEPGQIRESEYGRWYVGAGGQEFVCRFERLDGGPVERPLLPLPAWMFTAGMVGRPVGRWTGTLLDPQRDESS